MTVEQRRKNAAKTAAYRKEHPDRVRATSKRCYEKRKHTMDPEVLRRHRRKWHLKVNFGITLEQYDDLLKECGGLCTVCREPELSLRRGVLKSLDVDHDHATGQIRKLLCSGCNNALGILRENPLRIRALADYIERFK